ncbi:uridylate kinase [Klebsormidium nitens]|uniref:UMP kinase n=1 Tax=Klebsormidium nitens TaxID=105231 RepID=A0A1Y1IEY5_KLENI|nr:uridylate kinase [Klebsormidium nitens]|eukprot:GAQ87267.1 uridylate kinase [Klebsormidium nitens]
MSQSTKRFSVPLHSRLAGSKALGLLKHEPCPSASTPCDAPRSWRRGCQATQAEAQPSQEAVLPGPWFSPRVDRSEDTAMPSAPFASLDMPKPKWKRVLLKISGEALAGEKTSNIDPAILLRIAQEVAAIARLGVEVAVTVGGGNFFRGATWAGASGLDRASADQIGMMATVMNAIFLQASLESLGCPTRVQTAFKMAEVAEPYIRRRAMRHLEKGRVVIFGAGTGNPFFTTDTAAALRAAEINAEVVLKATNVDGVYDCDPRHNTAAQLHQHVSYAQVARDRLSVMDATAITLCAENDIPVVVFNLNIPGNISRALKGERIGTLIDQQGAQST